MVERKECERLGLRVKKRKNGENHDSGSHMSLVDRREKNPGKLGVEVETTIDFRQSEV